MADALNELLAEFDAQQELLADAVRLLEEQRARDLMGPQTTTEVMHWWAVRADDVIAKWKGHGPPTTSA